jgi:D-alanyl-D-alanine carboxypeptidase/D-alanyl-D-alanine-endopeptidase (penicillin-binding protein 4)
VALVAIVFFSAYLVVSVGRQQKADRDFHPIRVPAQSAPSAAIAAVLSDLAATPSAAPAPAPAASPTAAGVAQALAAGLSDPELGPNPSAEVLDASTGATLLNVRASAMLAPASTAKLLLAAAMLRVYKITDRFTTKVVAGTAPGTVVLVGGGDPTLTASVTAAGAAYPGAAKISDLAAQLKASGKQVSQILVDDSLFSGASTAPGWAAQDAPSEYASPITATMVDGGRDTPSALVRSATPDLAAGQALANALGSSTTGVALGSAPAGATVLAQVSSAPVGRLIEEMLQNSDDVIAEVLGRQVALAVHQPATFAGASTAVRETVAGLGINAGTTMSDVSGLSSLDRLSAATLTATLLASLSPAHPELHSIIAGLPVAGWDGTLSDRFTGAQSAGRGVVRAKTGSLSDQGVSDEAGIVTDADGRQLVFVLMTTGAPDQDGSRNALDTIASRLAGCGCR